MTLTSIANVSSFLRTPIDGTTTPSEAEVTEWIEEVSDEIEHITKQKFEENTVADLILPFDSDQTSTSASSFDKTGAYNLPAPRDEIFLPFESVLTLTKFEVNTVSDDSTPVWVEKTIGYGGDVVLDGNRITALSHNLVILAQKGSVRVSLTHGKATVPKFAQKLATRMTALSYLNSGISNDVTGGGGDIRVGDIQIGEPGKFSQDYIDSVEEWVNVKLGQLGTRVVRVI